MQAGISVKYGRKVLQRLEVVAPARTALREAMNAQPRKSSQLEAALKNARPAASLLDPQLLTDAEVRCFRRIMFLLLRHNAKKPLLLDPQLLTDAEVRCFRRSDWCCRC